MAFLAGNQSFEIMNDPLTIALWHACAGPLVTLPEKYEGVYYFPEGHLEHLKASLGPLPEQDFSFNNLQSKILFKVNDIHYRVVPVTDELFSKIDLLPHVDEVDPIPPVPKPANGIFPSFCKTLTPSDTSMHGGLFVHRRHAERCFPPLSMSQEIPSQELVATDLHNNEWRFKHVFRGQPKRHLITTGWKAFASSKKLVTGDAVIFLRDGNYNLRVGFRRAMSHQTSRSSSLISAEAMHVGVLASAAQALCTRSTFSVLYKPRTMSSEFLVSVNKYLESKNWEYTVGMRFTMSFKGEDDHERRFTGTIIGINANESRKWLDSEWRSLKVQWDEPFGYMPEKVSPWEIEPLGTNHNKRPRSLAFPSPTAGPSVALGLAISPPDIPSAVPLFSPSSKTLTIGESSNSALWPKHFNNGAETFAKTFSTEEKQTHGNGLRLFGVELVEPAYVPGPAAVVDDLVVPFNKMNFNNQCESSQSQSYREVHMLDLSLGMNEDMDTEEMP